MRQVLLRYFRHVRPGDQSSVALERSLRTALESKIDGRSVLDLWKLREWTDADYSPAKVMIANHLRPSPHNVFGDLLVTRPGQLDRLIDTSDPNTREAATRVVPTSNNAFLVRSSMFWLVEGDHVVICSSGLQPSAFEKYMTWLLRAYASLGKHEVDLDSTVAITDEDLQSIKEVSLGDNLIVHPGPKTEKRAKRQKLAAEDISGVQRVGVLRKALMAIYGSAEEADTLLDGVPIDQEIGWRFRLTYRRAQPGTSRKTLERAYRIANQEEHGEITLQTKQGRIKGDSLVLQLPADLETQADGMINRDQLLGKMQEALRKWKSDGRLE